jgi:hypothetical protein
LKKKVLHALVIVAGASLATAQTGGGIGIYSDTMGMDCNLWDNVAGLCSYYLVHVAIPGSINAATACQFSAPAPACLLAQWLSDTAIFPVTIGGSQTGVAVGYGSCLALPLHVLTMNFFCQALTGPCCQYDVLPDPALASGQIEVSDCNFVIQFGVGMCAVVNPDASCPCWATPVEETTWGKVKSLFSE